jgi:hypothetical protein
MAVTLSKTYDALIAAGAPEDKARAAAEELAGYESRFAKIETDLAVLKWMLGVVIAGQGNPQTAMRRRRARLTADSTHPSLPGLIRQSMDQRVAPAGDD